MSTNGDFDRSVRLRSMAMIRLKLSSSRATRSQFVADSERGSGRFVALSWRKLLTTTSCQKDFLHLDRSLRAKGSRFALLSHSLPREHLSILVSFYERNVALVKANKNAQMLSWKRMREKSEPRSLGPQ